jgi:hypothetical protein
MHREDRRLRCALLIAMVEAADFGDRDDRPGGDPSDRSEDEGEPCNCGVGPDESASELRHPVCHWPTVAGPSTRGYSLTIRAKPSTPRTSG